MKTKQEEYELDLFKLVRVLFSKSLVIESVRSLLRTLRLALLSATLLFLLTR